MKLSIQITLIMALLCTCPPDAAIADIPLENCPESMGQIQKAIFQRVFSAPDTRNTIANPKVLASWTPLLAASNGTKVVQSPYLQSSETEAGAALTYGGGNETLGGIELVIGKEPTSFTANILHTQQKTIKALKKLACETLGVWLVDENGNIGCLADDPDNPTAYMPIPIHSMFIGDKTFGGLESPDMNVISWNKMPNWSDNFVMVKPTDFNALTDLVTPTD
jgi:hypothetical protein